MNIKIELNDDSSSEESNLSKAVAKRKEAGVGETLDEAFSRILSMKNSDPDKRRIQSVQRAMADGLVGRESESSSKGKKLTKAEVLRIYKQVEAIEQERVLADMKDNMPDNYVLVNEIEQLNSMIRNVCKNDIIPIDVETTGTDIWSDYIVGYVISDVLEDAHYYVPTKHKTEETQLDHDFVTVSLRQVFEKPDALYIGHNIGYDLHMLRNEGVNVVGSIWDTQEAMRLLNENENSYALKPLVSKFLGMPSMTYGQLFGQVGFDEVSDLKVASSYACKDGDVTLRLYEFQKHHLKERFPSIYKYAVDIEMPLVNVVVELERTGFVIDKAYASKYGAEISKEIEEVRGRIDAVLGEINLNSPAQVKPALEEHTKRKLEDTNANKTLKPLAKQFPVVADILRYKELTKLYGTYVDKLPQAVREQTGKLMATFNQNGARTGRFSSGGSGINLQNQPAEARKLFVADEGKVLLGGDWSQQEYRALAAFSNEPRLIENYRSGEDLYKAVASEIFEKPLEECGDGSTYRKQAKVILLAIAYGTGAGTLSMQLGKSKKEAQTILDDFKVKYPTLGKWIESNKAFVQRHGYVWIGDKQRKRRLPDALDRSSDFWYTSVNTQSTNAVVQGSAAIQTKATMIELQKLCERKTAEGNGEWRIWAVVHDEAILEVPEGISERDVDDFVDVMVNTYEFGVVPNKTDVEMYRRWGVGMLTNEYMTGEVRREDYQTNEEYLEQIDIVREGWKNR